MADRYFVEEPLALGRAVLGGAEAHHLIHVMRAKAGTPVVLFDGSGAEFPAVVQRVGRSDMELSVVSREEVDRELPFVLTLGVTLPKGDRQKWLVEKATELGVTRIVPLETERSVAQPVDQALERLRRTVIEASKQCGRNRLMQIEQPQSWADFVRTADTPLRLLAHPASAVRHAVPSWTPAQMGARSVRLAVGPEGGFTNDEVALAISNDWELIDLGARTLRIETAALMLAAMVASIGRAF